MLKSGDAEACVQLLTEDSSGDRRFFQPFPFTKDALRSILAKERRDRYWGLYDMIGLVGLCMLRGLDQGYEIPSYGVYIASRARGKGLSRIALAHSLAWCRSQGITCVMLSVHPDNLAAKHVYETSGFVFTGQYSQRGHMVYTIHLQEQ